MNPKSCDKCPHKRVYQDGYDSQKFIVRCKALESKEFFDRKYEVEKYKDKIPWWCPAGYYIFSYNEDDE
jgi:hypothetical protein